MFEHKDRELLEEVARQQKELLQRMSANDDALAQLQQDVSDNTTATNAAIAALGSEAGGSDDISAGVTAAAETVAANTAALNEAVSPAGGGPVSPTPTGTPVDVPAATEDANGNPIPNTNPPES